MRWTEINEGKIKDFIVEERQDGEEERSKERNTVSGEEKQEGQKGCGTQENEREGKQGWRRMGQESRKVEQGGKEENGKKESKCEGTMEIGCLEMLSRAKTEARVTISSLAKAGLSLTPHAA